MEPDRLAEGSGPPALAAVWEAGALHGMPASKAVVDSHQLRRAPLEHSALVQAEPAVTAAAGEHLQHKQPSKVLTIPRPQLPLEQHGNGQHVRPLPSQTTLHNKVLRLVLLPSNAGRQLRPAGLHYTCVGSDEDHISGKHNIISGAALGKNCLFALLLRSLHCVICGNFFYSALVLLCTNAGQLHEDLQCRQAGRGDVKSIKVMKLHLQQLAGQRT